MPDRDEMPEAQLDILREQIKRERKTLQAQLAQPPRRKRGAKTNERSKLREIFRQCEGFSDT